MSAVGPSGPPAMSAFALLVRDKRTSNAQSERQRLVARVVFFRARSDMIFDLLWPFVFERPEAPRREFLALCGSHGAFIDTQAKTWALWQRDVSIHRTQRVWA